MAKKKKKHPQTRKKPAGRSARPSEEEVRRAMSAFTKQRDDSVAFRMLLHSSEFDAIKALADGDRKTIFQVVHEQIIRLLQERLDEIPQEIVARMKEVEIELNFGDDTPAP